MAVAENPTPQELQSWLEWAGERLLLVQVRGTWPDSYRSFWPDYPDDPLTAYGYTGERLRLSSPSAPDIATMDMILNLVVLSPDILQRRVLNSRALINPRNGRHVFSWTKIAILIHSNDWSVRQLHKKGLIVLSHKIPISLANRIRSAITFGPSLSP